SKVMNMAFSQGEKASAAVQLAAGSIHVSELFTLKVNHVASESTPSVDPVVYLLGIDLPQELSSSSTYTSVVLVRRCMKSKPSAPGNTDTTLWDHSQDHRASRQAWAVDDDPFSRVPERDDSFKFGANLTTGVSYDPHVGVGESCDKGRKE
ncbi:hypothetical protein KW798_03020, partial [Candidatus Parcubacteria bacterium]|nr:hypothetical protein [Candidatus Parcubacteria bacterium]